MSDGENNIDLSTFVPETFKGEDGTFDTAKFRTSYDELAAFKGQNDDRLSQLPKEAADYAFALPEGHEWPEGFDAAKFTTKNEKGEDVPFDFNQLFDKNDPDVSALQAIMHEAKADPSLLGKIVSVVANREMRGMMESLAKAETEKKALGPEVDSRIRTVEHALKAKMPAEQAKDLLDGITTANALRGFEALLKGAAGSPTPPAPQKRDMSELPRVDRIAQGLQERKRA